MCQNLFQKVGQTSEIHVRIDARLHVTVKNHARTFSMNIYVQIYGPGHVFSMKRTRAPINLRIMWAT